MTSPSGSRDPDAPPAPPAGRDVSVSMQRASTIGLVLFPVLALLLVPFWVVHGWPALRDGLLTAITPWIFLPAFALSIVAHEGLHALGFLLFGGAPRRALHFGIDRATLSPFAGCRVPLAAAAYRGAVALPALVLGVLPVAAGFATGSGFLAVWGTFMLQSAGGDLVVLWTIRALPGGARVMDHPTRVGCRVLDPPGADPAPAAAEG